MDITIIEPMLEAEARDCVNRLRQHLTDARMYAHVLYTREGWKALGYTSLKECFITELGASWQHGYRLINAAEVDQDLSEFSPTGEKFVIPETHARQLYKLPSEKRYVAYDRAKTLASTEGAKQVTARHVEKAVEQIEAEISLQDNPVVARAVAAGEITPADGVKIHHELTALPLQYQAKVLTIMTEHGLRDPRLVAPLAEMATRPAGRGSKVLEEIERTGHVAGVPLREASLSDLEKLKEEARQEHISEGIEARRQQQMAKGGPVTEVKVITVYVHEPMKTLNALVRALPLDDLKAVAELMMTHVVAEMEKEQYAQ